MNKETPQQIIERLHMAIEERKPAEYSEMITDQADVMYLNEAEREEFNNAKLALPNQAQEAYAARARNLARVNLRRIKK